MAAGRSGTGDPLHVTRRPHDRVVRDRLSRGVVEEMGPLVDACRPGLDGLLPRAVLAEVEHALRRQHAQHFLHGDVAKVLRHDQVHQVVCIRQPLPVERVDRDLAVSAERLDGPPGLLDRFRVGIQTVHQVAVADMQRRGEPAVATAEVNDQPALDSGRPEDLPCQLALWSLIGRCGTGDRRVG